MTIAYVSILHKAEMLLVHISINRFDYELFNPLLVKHEIQSKDTNHDYYTSDISWLNI